MLDVQNIEKILNEYYNGNKTTSTVLDELYKKIKDNTDDLLEFIVMRVQLNKLIEETEHNIRSIKKLGKEYSKLITKNKDNIKINTDIIIRNLKNIEEIDKKYKSNITDDEREIIKQARESIKNNLKNIEEIDKNSITDTDKEIIKQAQENINNNLKNIEELDKKYKNSITDTDKEIIKKAREKCKISEEIISKNINYIIAIDQRHHYYIKSIIYKSNIELRRIILLMKSEFINSKAIVNEENNTFQIFNTSFNIFRYANIYKLCDLSIIEKIIILDEESFKNYRYSFITILLNKNDSEWSNLLDLSWKKRIPSSIWALLEFKSQQLNKRIHSLLEVKNFSAHLPFKYTSSRADHLKKYLDHYLKTNSSFNRRLVEEYEKIFLIFQKDNIIAHETLYSAAENHDNIISFDKGLLKEYEDIFLINKIQSISSIPQTVRSPLNLTLFNAHLLKNHVNLFFNSHPDGRNMLLYLCSFNSEAFGLIEKNLLEIILEAQKEDMEEKEELYKKFPSKNYTTLTNERRATDGNSALHESVKAENLEAFELLLKYNPPSNSVNLSGISVNSYINAIKNTDKKEKFVRLYSK